MKLLIVAGGGGHFSPALAVIEKIPKNWKVLLIGRKYTFEGENALSFEYQTATMLKIPFSSINTGRLQRKITRHSLISLLRTPQGFYESLAILRKFKPDVLLSFGGYVSVPVCFAAYFLKIPIVVHEQTLGAGLANKVVAKFASKICISWEESGKFFPKDKTIITGNPLRSEFLNNNFPTRYENSQNASIYVTGGSSGSHAINALIEKSLGRLLKKYSVIHQTGDSQEYRDYDRLMDIRALLPPEMKKNYNVQKFIDPKEVVEIMKNVSIVVSRSGINTVTELIYLRKPCFLIPLPYGQKNEQLKNALFLKQIGLAEIGRQQMLDSGSFIAKIEYMLKNIKRYKLKADIKNLVFSNSSEKIVEVIRDVGKQTKK